MGRKSKVRSCSHIVLRWWVFTSFFEVHPLAEYWLNIHILKKSVLSTAGILANVLLAGDISMLYSHVIRLSNQNYLHIRNGDDPISWYSSDFCDRCHDSNDNWISMDIDYPEQFIFVAIVFESMGSAIKNSLKDVELKNMLKTQRFHTLKTCENQQFEAGIPAIIFPIGSCDLLISVTGSQMCRIGLGSIPRFWKVQNANFPDIDSHTLWWTFT